MTFARLRKALILGLVAVLIGLIPVFVLAANPGPDYKATAEPAMISNFGDKVTVTIEITNNTDAQFGPITMTDPGKNSISSFGNNGAITLQSGESYTFQDVHAVSDKEAGAGSIVYYMNYNDVFSEDDGTEHIISVEKPVIVPVSFDGTVIQLTADRQIDVGAARQGDTFLIVYTLTNTGTVDITDIKIKETATKKVENYSGPLKPGEQKKISFMVSMGGTDMVSSAEITFRANDAAQTATVGEQVIRLGIPGLSLTVSCGDDDVNIGGAATLDIAFENKGTISYSNITVSDKKLGTLLEGLSIEAGESRSFSKEVILEGPTEFELSAIMDDNTGKTGLSVKSNKLTVNAYDPDKSIHLTLNLTAEQTSSAEFPFEVMFYLTVTNTSNVTAKDITIYQENAGGPVELATVKELKAGRKVIIPRMVSVPETGKYRWSASCVDELKNKVSFDSETISITRGAVVTPTPAITPRPTLTPAPAISTLIEEAKTELKARYDDEYKPAIEKSESQAPFRKIVVPVIALLALAALCLLIVSIILRIAHAAKHASAYDHMDLIAQRDFKAESTGKGSEDKEPKEEGPHDFRKESDFEPSVDINDDSLTIGASVESNGAGSYMVFRGNNGTQAEAAQEAGTQAANDTPAEEAAEDPLSRMKARHAVKINNNSEEE